MENFETVTEYVLSTLDGDVFFTTGQQNFNKMAAAAFAKLAELYSLSDDNDEQIVVQVSVREHVPGKPEIDKTIPFGYLSWNLKSKP